MNRNGSDLAGVDGRVVRNLCRAGEWKGSTPGLALGYVQANLVIVREENAFDFLLFCQRNPKPCPILDVTDVGSARPAMVAPDADLRTDLPMYRVYKDGELTAEPTDLNDYWEENLVAFLLGCSFTFEHALQQAKLPVRHIEMDCNVPMYNTSIACRSAGIFRGNMVVSMRPMLPRDAVRAVQICSRYPLAHGAPIHIGNPEDIGIFHLTEPDYGDAVDFQTGEVPVFWACGVTPQTVAISSQVPFFITHKPGHMFLTDLRDSDLESMG
ncbi:MAG: putative hydro-lyase [Gemmataceae bacterium]